MSNELRCTNGILHGKLVDGELEVTCRSNRCGYMRGVVILHRFSMESGDLLRTLRFQEPARGRSKANDNAHSPAVRAS